MPHAAMLKTAAAIVVVGPRSTDRASCRLDTDRKTCISEQKTRPLNFADRARWTTDTATGSSVCTYADGVRG
jgi:hypothetical protein